MEKRYLRSKWVPGKTPVAVVMISLNEGHNIEAVLQNISGWAQEVFLVDSLSGDDTVEIALRYGVHVIQRPFRNFGDQWNFSLNELPINAPWTMKLDPDERLTNELKSSIHSILEARGCEGVILQRRLWFMGVMLPITQPLLRIWRTGICSFTEVPVNEHPVVLGNIVHAKGFLEHHDSPNLEHWIDKQNQYTSAEAAILYNESKLAYTPKLFGKRLQRRMWMKKNFHKVPGRFFLFFLYNYIIQGAWQAGVVGYIWAKLRSDVMRFIDYKYREMRLIGQYPAKRRYSSGRADDRVKQYK